MERTPAAMTMSLIPALIAALSAAAEQGPPDGADVMRRVNAEARGDSARFAMKLILRDPRRGVLERSLSVERKKFEGGYRTRYFVESPEALRGVTMLIAEDLSQPMWVYLPYAGVLTPIASRGFAALASDFSCEDLRVARMLDDYTFRTMGTEKIAGVEYVQVEMIPRDDRLRGELGFSRAIGWIRPGPWLIERAEYFDAAGKRLKTFTAARLERIGGVWIHRELRMEDAPTNHVSEVHLERVELDVPLAVARFEPDAQRPATSR
jgi:hypothetical protein